MRFAETNKLMGSILISPSYTDLGDELEKQSGYFDKLWEWESIKSNIKNIALFYGDNDPYIPQEQYEYITVKLKPVVIKVVGGKHFEDYKEFPQLIDFIKNTYLVR